MNKPKSKTPAPAPRPEPIARPAPTVEQPSTPDPARLLNQPGTIKLTFSRESGAPQVDVPEADAVFEVAGIMPFGTSLNTVASFRVACRTNEGVTEFWLVSGNVDPGLTGRSHAAGKLAARMQKIAVHNQNRVK